MTRPKINLPALPQDVNSPAGRIFLEAVRSVLLKLLFGVPEPRKRLVSLQDLIDMGVISAEQADNL